ncbi:MAG: glycine betaine ABC transporter substrate-binding protein [Bacillota bacterium]
MTNLQGKLGYFLVGILLLAVTFGWTLQATAQDPVVVGSKEFTEQIILGQLTLQLLEANGISTVDETNLGGTIILREAQLEGEVDLAWEYTGTALITHLGFEDPITDSEEAYQVVKEEDSEQNNLIWLDYAPMNNTYTIMMREDDAENLGIASLSDLAEAINEGLEAPEPGQWLFATNHEYSVREDGYPGLTEHYGFEFDGVQTMESGITYGALRDGDVAVAMGFATDGRIDGFDLVNLKDDKNYHPVYNAAPVIREETLDQYPEIEEILQPLVDSLDDETIQSLNAQVDVDGEAPDEVAADFLENEGLLD